MGHITVTAFCTQCEWSMVSVGFQPELAQIKSASVHALESGHTVGVVAREGCEIRDVARLTGDGRPA